MTGTTGFIGERLTQARQARGLTGVALAEILGLESSNISNYEHGRQTPSSEIMERIVTVLNQPFPFFLKRLPEHRNEEVWYRSMSSATKLARTRAEARHGWLREIVAYLEDYLDLPDVKLPHFDLPEDFRQITSEVIEEIATECRTFWKLGNGPVADIVLLLENHGVILTRGELGAETLDAYSQQSDNLNHPMIFLGADKASAARSRHDASHELGHLILHRKVKPSHLNHALHFKMIEDQAHRFAAAFNLPAKGFADQLWSPTLDAFLAMKQHWKVSIGSMIVRCGQLGILSEEQTRRAWINMSRKKWRSCEPLDDRLLPERPLLLRRSFELLVDENIKTPSQIIADLCLNPKDIEGLACLDPGYLSGEIAPSQTLPQLREDLFLKTGTGNVVVFGSRRSQKV